MTMEELIERSDERRSERRHQQMLKADDGYYEACLLAKVDELINQITQKEVEEAIVETLAGGIRTADLQQAYRTEDALQFGRIMINVVSSYWRPIITTKIQESGDL